MSDAQQSRLDLALAAGRRAGALALGSFQKQSLKVDIKPDRSVVTEADRGAEALVREMIDAAFPEDGIVGEEWGVKKGSNDWIWYLDPIDGTQAFVRGVPLFGTLIGVEHGGVSKIGVIEMPALNESVFAAKDSGCWWRRGDQALERARVSSVSSMADAMFCTTWMKSFTETGTVPLFTALCEGTGVFRGWGDCYGYALVATGRAEIMVDPLLMVWDAAPLLIVIEEAGGRYVTLEGEASIHGGSGIATNGHLHEQVMELVAAQRKAGTQVYR